MVLAHSRELGDRLPAGGSLAVAGVCLTVTERRTGDAGPASAPVPAAAETSAFPASSALSVVEVSPETLRRTTLGGLAAGSEVNLEPPLRAGDPLGGHWVQGHVDGTATVREVRSAGDHREVVFALPPELGRYLVEKGSVALDGVSLTISSRGRDAFEVALVPHTLEVTTLSRLAPGDRVNLEVDILAKYVEQLVRGEAPR